MFKATEVFDPQSTRTIVILPNFLARLMCNRWIKLGDWVLVRDPIIDALVGGISIHYCSECDVRWADV